MEHPDPVRADPAGQEHVAQLRDRGIGQDLLDVVLDDRDGRRHESGDTAHRGHDPHRGLRHLVERAEPRHHVDAGRDHGRGMDECGNRSRALHRVGKPDVKGNLRALAAGADEERDGDESERAEHPQLFVGHLPHSGDDVDEVEGAQFGGGHGHADDQAGVPHPIDDEGLLARVRRALLLEPEADQEVGAEPHPFPAHEHEGQRSARDQDQHEEGEEVQVGEVPDPLLVVGHVADRVDMDQETDARDHQHQGAGQGVDQEGHGDDETRRRRSS